MVKENVVLQSKASLMVGRQRISCTLEISDDGTVKLYKKRDGSLLFEAPASSIVYSAGSIIKSRIRLTTSTKSTQAGVRLGVGTIISQRSNSKNLPNANGIEKKTKAVDVLIGFLKKYGASEDPKQPEAKIDTIGALVFCISLLTIATMTAIAVLVR